VGSSSFSIRTARCIIIYMSERERIPLPLRATVAVVIGCALVTGWLQPLYELLIVRGSVFVPKWWTYLHLVSLAALLFLCFFLWRRSWRLSMVTWCAFVVSVLANCIPGYVRSAT
jgi:hypothetical protein